jgi:mono/diheme cytochrome c family protein
MRRWIKRTVVALGVLVAAGAAALAAGTQLAERKLNRRIELAVAPLAYRDDAGSIERGRYLFASRGCAECHGASGAGHVVIDDGKGMRVKSPNISPGAGNVVAAYRPEDWVRTIRHGVKPDGRPLIVMPSEDYNRFTDGDLAALVAYVRQLPPAPGTPAEIRLPTLVKLLYAAGAIPDAAEKIDHSLPPSQPVPEGVTAEHGRYVVNMCIGCHGEHLSGGKIPGGPPDWPAAANLTPGAGSAMPRYASAEAFVAMLRTGQRPDGSAVSPVMPFAALKELNETDMRAAHLYLKTLPPREAGGR